MGFICLNLFAVAAGLAFVIGGQMGRFSGWRVRVFGLILLLPLLSPIALRWYDPAAFPAFFGTIAIPGTSLVVDGDKLEYVGNYAAWLQLASLGLGLIYYFVG